MADDLGPTLEQDFHNRLLAAVIEVRHHTRLGTAKLLENIQHAGGLQAAKSLLHRRDPASEFGDLAGPSPYFLAANRAGHPELSVEAMALNPEWQCLFTREERDWAAATVAEGGSGSASPVVTPSADTSALTSPSRGIFLTLEHKGHFDDLDELSFSSGQRSGCDLTSRLAARLRDEGGAPARRAVRKHLGGCPDCRVAYPELTAAFERFDATAADTWIALMKVFEASMELADEHLKRFHPLGPEDYQDLEDYEVDLGVQLNDWIRPVCEWRAVRVGCQVGRFMKAFARTFDERGDLWLKWRKREVQGLLSDRVCRIDRQLFILALAAQNLLLVRSWPREDEDILWAPADESLPSSPGILQLEATDDLRQWRELLGDPPQDVNLIGVLYLANLAGVAQLGEFESSPNHRGLTRELQQWMDQVSERLENIERFNAESLQRQDAVVDELMRMAEHMEATDRHTCEQSLLARLSETWGKLTPDVRSLMLASEQMCRIPVFAAPGKVIDGMATAFERQLLHSIVSPLFDHLRRWKVPELRPLPEWPDAEQRGRPLWWPTAKAEKCTLGAARLILRHPEPAVGDFFDQFGFDRTAIRGAIETVSEHRNPAVHGGSFDIWTAETIRADWLSWQGRVGGVYSVFFRSE